jgi:hypothetical protein
VVLVLGLPAVDQGIVADDNHDGVRALHRAYRLLDPILGDMPAEALGPGGIGRRRGEAAL